MRTKNLTLAVLLSFSAGIMFSCSDTTESDLILVDDSEFSENVFTQISSDIDEAIIVVGSTNERTGIGNFSGFGGMGCVTRTVQKPDSTEFPKIIILTFGDNCRFSAVDKSGSIIITLTGPRREMGSQCIVTFENFTVNGNQIEGTKTYTYAGDHIWIMELTGGKITTSEGKVITREESRTRTQVQGKETEELSDDVFEITGSAYGTTAEGVEYSREITVPLVKNRECFWILSGVIETLAGDNSVTLDFGNGECDDKAVRTVNGDSEEIKMKYRMQWMHQWRKLKGN